MLAWSPCTVLLQEVEKICEAVVERNAYTEAVGAKRGALEAWRQVVEVILAACPPDLLAGEARQCVILELLSDLLQKVGTHLDCATSDRDGDLENDLNPPALKTGRNWLNPKFFHKKIIQAIPK